MTGSGGKGKTKALPGWQRLGRRSLDYARDDNYFTSIVTMRPLMGASPGITSALVSMFSAL